MEKPDKEKRSLIDILKRKPRDGVSKILMPNHKKFTVKFDNNRQVTFGDKYFDVVMREKLQNFEKAKYKHLKMIVNTRGTMFDNLLFTFMPLEKFVDSYNVTLITKLKSCTTNTNIVEHFAIQFKNKNYWYNG